MKLRHMTITVLSLFALSLTNAQASNRQVGGLLVGGGTGAVVGHAVGHTTESVIVGAAVGGMVGLIVGTELDRHHRDVHHEPTVVVYNTTYKHHKGPEMRGHYPHRPQFHNGRQNYRKTVVIEKGHHQTRRTVTTFRGNGPGDHYRRGTPDRHSDRFHH